MNNLFQDTPNLLALMNNPQANNIPIPPMNIQNPPNPQNPIDTSNCIYIIYITIIFPIYIFLYRKTSSFKA